jgi:hypothetical protein
LGALFNILLNSSLSKVNHPGRVVVRLKPLGHLSYLAGEKFALSIPSISKHKEGDLNYRRLQKHNNF